MSYFPPIVAALVTFLLTYILLFSKAANKIQDIPNVRSLHSVPVPRVGGLALIVGMFSGWAMLFNTLTWWIVLSLLALLSVSVLDDMRGLSVRYRLLVHCIAAWLLVYGCGLFAQSMLAGILVMLISIWSINLYNFMDGSDGLAGGMTLFGFGMYGIAAYMGDDVPFAMLNFSISAAALSFLYFNFYPARIFMGDAGSIPLGFLVAAIGVWGYQNHLWVEWFPMLVFSPFLLDASVTLFKRVLRREKVWQAHCEHYYQRMVQMGIGHRNTAMIEYTLMVLVGTSGIIGLQYPAAVTGILVLWGMIFLSAILLIDYFWKIRK